VTKSGLQDGQMPAASHNHGRRPEQQDVYHDNDDCPDGKRIEPVELGLWRRRKTIPRRV
jgi:hypothetical protein